MPSDVAYREVPVLAALRPWVEAAWVLRVGTEPPPKHRVLPDGCVDIVGSIGGALAVAGPATSADVVDLDASSDHFGLRFRPGVASVVLGLAASELRDSGGELVDVWPAPIGRKAERSVEQTDAVAAVRVLQDDVAVVLQGRPAPDRQVLTTIDRLATGEPASVSALGHEVGLGDRQLRRRFEVAVGYGPKQLDRVLRFQRTLAAAQRRSAAGSAIGWADLAADAGYADQSHLVREWRALGGLAPTALLADRPSSPELLSV